MRDKKKNRTGFLDYITWRAAHGYFIEKRDQEYLIFTGAMRWLKESVLKAR